MLIPISVFFIPYFLFLAVFFFFSFANVYHFIHFGRATGLVGFFSTVLFLIVTALIFYYTYMAVIVIDWSRIMELPTFSPSTFFESGV